MNDSIHFKTSEISLELPIWILFLLFCTVVFIDTHSFLSIIEDKQAETSKSFNSNLINKFQDMDPLVTHGLLRAELLETSTMTLSPSPSETSAITGTVTPTTSPTPTITSTTDTPTPSDTASQTPNLTHSPTNTVSPSPTETFTPVYSETTTPSPTTTLIPLPTIVIYQAPSETPLPISPSPIPTQNPSPTEPNNLVDQLVQSGNFPRVAIIILIGVLWSISAAGVYIFLKNRFQ